MFTDSIREASSYFTEADSIPRGEGRRILVSIATGFELRQLIHSAVVYILLRQGFEVMLVSPNAERDGFAKELVDKRVAFRSLSLGTGPFMWRYWGIRKYLLMPVPLTETLRQSIVTLHEHLPFPATATRVINRALRSVPGLRPRVLRWEGRLLRNEGVESLFDGTRIDAVLLGSPGYTIQDTILLHAAVRRRIPVAATVLSWDNLSSKGVINPQPDRLLVWSDHMKQEAINFRLMPEERIIETGAPLYDVFSNPQRFGSRAENLKHLGLDPARRLIFYGTNIALHFPDQIEVVKRLAQWVEDDRLAAPCQLWVRLHPQAIAGPYKVMLDPYRKLASKRVKIEFPPVRESNLLWDLPRNDIEHLVRLLRDADVVINMASTLSIDAAVLDRPVISIAFDPSGDLPYDRSVRRFYDYTHMAHVVQAGAVQLAKSPEDLREKIMSYLAHPEQDREGRRRIVEQQFGRVDGHSAMRVVEEVLALVLKNNHDQTRTQLTS
jgi:CDP-Glycerol:Poly(glycerophosphate) glycerophosphotransferase